MYPALVSTISWDALRALQPYLPAHSDAAGKPFSSISRSPVVKMNEKSADGSSRRFAAGARPRPAGAAPRPAVDAGITEAKFPRPGLPPRRPPDRLSHPSTMFLKKSVRMMRFDVRPPCEWPASQKALMFARPICSTTDVTMFCRYSSSASDQVRVGEFGVAMTRRYVSL